MIETICLEWIIQVIIPERYWGGRIIEIEANKILDTYIYLDNKILQIKKESLVICKYCLQFGHPKNTIPVREGGPQMQRDKLLLLQGRPHNRRQWLLKRTVHYE